MSEQPNIPKIGDNNPPIFDADAYADLETRAREFADAAGEWKDAGAIETEERAQKANDFLAGTRNLHKEIEDARKSEKKPHLDAGRTIDTEFKKLTDLLARAANMVRPLSQAYLQAKEAEEVRKRAEAEKKAREEAERAEADRRAAEARNDVAGEQEAEERAKAAQEEAKKAQEFKSHKVSSATGGGRTQSLRTVRTANVTNINQAMLHYRENPEMEALLLKLANADIRAANGDDISIPGIEITTHRKL